MEEKKNFEDEEEMHSEIKEGNNFGTHNQSKSFGEIDTMNKLTQQYVPLIFNIIHKIFESNAPKATLKIGLIYLAKINHYYPEFSELYLSILLSVPDNIRQSVLECVPEPGTEEEALVSGACTEKYRTYGAPMEWNPEFIATYLEKLIKTQNLENLEQSHVEIFDACLQQDFYEDSHAKWLEIFDSLKSYFFISLCDRDFCKTSIEILKKIYVNEVMQDQFIQESKTIFVKTLKLLYQPDVDQECKDNVRDFLEYLHECEMSTPNLKKLVYDVIKYFAEKNTEKFQNSNLIDLTDNVVFKMRGEIEFP